MFITSINDPEIFNPVNIDRNSHYTQLLSDHIDRLFFSHIQILDNTAGNSIIGQKISGYTKKLKSNKIQERLNALISLSRIVRLKPDGARFAKIKSHLDNDASATAVAIAGYPNDVFIVNQDTLAAMQLSEISQDKTVQLHEYHSSRAAEIEDKYRYAFQISGMKTIDFEREILNPTLRWACYVRIIDKMINQVAFPKVSGGGQNWNSFKATIKRINDIWRQGQGFKINRNMTFEIISLHTNTSVGDAEAKALAEKLDLPKTGHVVIRLKSPADPSIKEDFHDRYIQTNQFRVGFTKGFDISKSDGTCSASAVYRYPMGDISVNKVVSSRDSGYYVW